MPGEDFLLLRYTFLLVYMAFGTLEVKRCKKALQNVSALLWYTAKWCAKPYFGISVLRLNSTCLLKAVVQFVPGDQ